MKGITFIRQLKKLTTAQFAQELGVSQATISGWENKRNIPKAKAEIVAKKYNVDVFLLNREVGRFEKEVIIDAMRDSLPEIRKDITPKKRKPSLMQMIDACCKQKQNNDTGLSLKNAFKGSQYFVIANGGNFLCVNGNESPICAKTRFFTSHLEAEQYIFAMQMEGKRAGTAKKCYYNQKWLVA